MTKWERKKKGEIGGSVYKVLYSTHRYPKAKNTGHCRRHRSSLKESTTWSMKLTKAGAEECRVSELQKEEDSVSRGLGMRGGES